MNTRITTALLAAFTLAPLAALAESPSYSYVEGGYVLTDIDGIGEDADGFLLRGSIEITDDFFLFAGYTDQGIAGIDLKQYGVGAGYAWSMTDTTDLYGKVGYVKAEADLAGFGVDDDGYSLGVGIRSFVMKQLELEAAVSYVDLSDSGDDTTFGAGARWYFTEHFALGVEAEVGDDATSYGIGLRWSF
jgi:hypothetical protein